MPQRKNAKRTSADTTSNWIRIGVLSAMVTAPLIARWNEMQASYRAQNLRELATARLSDARIARDQAMVRLAPIREAANARIGDARVLANARFDDAINRLAQVRTPDALQNVPPFSLARKRLTTFCVAPSRATRQCNGLAPIRPPPATSRFMVSHAIFTCRVPTSGPMTPTTTSCPTRPSRRPPSWSPRSKHWAPLTFSIIAMLHIMAVYLVRLNRCSIRPFPMGICAHYSRRAASRSMS